MAPFEQSRRLAMHGHSELGMPKSALVDAEALPCYSLIRDDRDRASDVIDIARDMAVHVTQANKRPGAFGRGGALDGELFQSGARVGIPAARLFINGITVGLRARVDRFRRTLHHRIEVVLVTANKRRTIDTGMRGDDDCAGCAIDFAGDAGLVPKPDGEQAVGLADRNAGVGNLYLYVVAPLVGIGACRPRTVGFVLHGGKPVLEAGGDSLAGK